MLKKETGKKKKNVDKKDLKLKSKNRIVLFVLAFILFLLALGVFGIVYLGKNYESVSRSNIKLSENKDFKFVSDLSVGDTLFEDNNSSNVSPTKIVSIDKKYKNETVYNFTAINGPATYLANGFAVHNKSDNTISAVIIPYGSTYDWDDSSFKRELPAPAVGNEIKWATQDVACPAIPSTAVPGLALFIPVEQQNGNRAIIDNGTFYNNCSDQYPIHRDASGGNVYLATLRPPANGDYRLYGFNLPANRTIQFYNSPAISFGEAVYDPIRSGETWNYEDGPYHLTAFDVYNGYTKTYLFQDFDFTVESSGQYGFAANGQWAPEGLHIWEVGSPTEDPYVNGGNMEPSRLSGGGSSWEEINAKSMTRGKTYHLRLWCIAETGYSVDCEFYVGKLFDANGDYSIRLGVVPKTPPPCEIVPDVICKNNYDDYIIDTDGAPGNLHGIINNVESLDFHKWNVYAQQGMIDNSVDHLSGRITLGRILSPSSDIATGAVRYNHNDAALRCSADYKVFRNPTVNVNVNLVSDCNDLSDPDSLIEPATVGSVSVISGTTLEELRTDGIFQDIPLIDTVNCNATAISACTTDCSIDTYFRIDVGQDALTTNGYEACPTGLGNANNGWTGSGNLYSNVYTVSASNNNDQTLNFYVRQVLPDVQTPSWISIDKGNYTIVDDFTMSSDGYGVYDDTLVSELGSVFSVTSPILGALTNGDVGPLAPSDTNKVYVYDGESNSNNIATKLTDYLNAHSALTELPENVEIRDCSIKAEVSSDSILYYHSQPVCNLELNATEIDTLYQGGAGEVKMLVVEGNLTIDPDVDAIPFPIIVKGDLNAQ